MAGPPIGNRWGEALAAYADGLLAQALGQPAQAESLLHRALSIQAELGLGADAVFTIDALAEAAARGQSWQEAARLLGGAGALGESIGLVRSRPAEARRQANDAGCRRALGEAAFEVALGEGAALHLGELAAYANRARGARGRPATGWDSLTPTELRVVACVTQGMTNPEIASKLFMSRPTVKTHLAHVFSKLEVATRSELAAAAARRQAEPPVPAR